MKARTFVVLALANLMFALFGCTSSNEQVDTPSVFLASPSQSPSRGATAIRTRTITAVDQKTATSAKTTTSTPIPSTPTLAPLSKTGPWLLFYNRMDTGRGFGFGGDLHPNPIFSNADGSAWEPANLPYNPALDEPQRRKWYDRINKKGPYIAFHEYIDFLDMNYGPFSPTCDKNEFARPDENGRFNMLYILKLPENKIINQFRLFGDKAIEQFRSEECAYAKKGSHEIPPVLGTILNSVNFVWSPDGRYLVFTAAPEGPAADLYLYDTKTNTFRRLTRLQNNPMFMSWSPDGSIGLYKSMTKMIVDIPWQEEISGVHAVSIEGQDRVLFNNDINFIGWLSPTQIIVDDGSCETQRTTYCATNLRLINIPDVSSVRDEVIYSNPDHAYEFVIDPDHQLILVAGRDVMLYEMGKTAATPDMAVSVESDVLGVYQFDLKTRTMKKIIDGDIGALRWDPRLRAFQGTSSASSGPYGLFYLRFEPGKGWVEMPDYRNVHDRSPDGQWFIRWVEEKSENVISDIHGNQVQKIEDDLGFGCFSPASDAYVEMVPEHVGPPRARLIIYERQNNWKPNVIRSIDTDQSWLCTWITP